MIERFQLRDGKTFFSLSISHESATSIFSNGVSGFHAWSGGCGISGSVKSMDDARKICFDSVTSDIDRKIREFETRLSELHRLRETLGNDVFNLGQFKLAA